MYTHVYFALNVVWKSNVHFVLCLCQLNSVVFESFSLNIMHTGKFVCPAHQLIHRENFCVPSCYVCSIFFFPCVQNLDPMLKDFNSLLHVT